MALESFGQDTAKKINSAVVLCHDLLLDKKHVNFDPSNPSKGLQFQAGEEGIWRVTPSVLDGEPAVEIRLGVG